MTYKVHLRGGDKFPGQRRTLCGQDITQHTKNGAVDLPLASVPERITCANCLTVFYERVGKIKPKWTAPKKPKSSYRSAFAWSCFLQGAAVGVAVTIMLSIVFMGIAHAQPQWAAPGQGGTTYYTVNGQTVSVTHESLPAVPYRTPYPEVDQHWSLFDWMVFGDPKIKINCNDPINRFDKRCPYKAPAR